MMHKAYRQELMHVNPCRADLTRSLHLPAECMLSEDPLMTIRVSDKKVGLTAFVTIHNLGDQGACGGVRCVPDITEDEVKALARAMAYKYAFFEQAQGGGKGGMVMAYDTPPLRRRELTACLGAHLRPLLASGYVPRLDRYEFYGRRYAGPL